MRGLAFPDSSLMAATFTSTYTCLGGGTISRTIEASSAPFTGTGPSSFFGRRVFNDCILLRASRFLQNGNREVYWDQLATTSPYLQIGSNLKVALNRTITDRFRSISVKVVGTGERITSGNERIASQATWSAVSSSSSTYSVTITESRIGSNSRGATIFDHSITTPTALVHTVSGTGSNRRRTINGSVKVSHNILKFDTLTTFKDVVWDASTCKPVSGEATVVITGSRTGGGTINFSTDSASYSYSGTSGSSSGTVEFTGCTTNI
ncbi:putative lipoprotein [Leptospira ryugenii]|uniref:Putative lipoprotein n=2 Tax=Leptospira ryugenii TaxID=1917863 RepID=A0A2P2E1J0_9LEPT|nr:putative lipoprotein [Leptospira ryugenii]